METIKRILHYLANLEWSERRQDICIFCDRRNFAAIVYEDADLIAVENTRLAGQYHWLIMPKAHIRDVEALSHHHLALVQAMDAVKKLLLRKCPEVPEPSAVLAGYHRGRRPLLANAFYPDIVSIHHLHLHVITSHLAYARWSGLHRPRVRSRAPRRDKMQQHLKGPTVMKDKS
ncbi:hypothetical protein CDD80_2020 [Ophiocordyceps camponoti-rufipedis]|uniref:HIT domain-containing protein n=1 Tax=Ophiocordyceps camponoti-rufipedis TaxID=2004952 RepID=A0A2C5Z205_9HYPO|nr:hypothetical protein CDD80_2020 [Ophiocordyceps camponoti-rufipedis]